MAEYIDRNKLLDEIYRTKAASRHSFPRQSFVVGDVLELIRIAPVEDVAPVVHGEWVWNPDGMDWGLGAWKCSGCAYRNNILAMNSKINPLIFSGSKYCPNCGAKMEDVEGISDGKEIPRA